MREQLLMAQAQAAALFTEIERRRLIHPGASEESISEAVFELGASLFGMRKHWHRRVVRAGANTRLPFSSLPANRVVADDDIVSLDLGPVFEDYEADFGRTFVVGDHTEKWKLRDDLQVIFQHCKGAYLQRPSMSGAELYGLVVGVCESRGWGFGGSHAGHLVGAFPIPTEDRAAAVNRIRPDNHTAMDQPDISGLQRHWILEVHLLDPTGEFGGFYEDGLNF